MNKCVKYLVFIILASFCAFIITGCKPESPVVNKYTIYFESNGGTQCENIETFGNEILNLPIVPTKEGYLFGGWFLDDGIWEQPFTEESLINIDLNCDIIVYAKWNNDNVIVLSQYNKPINNLSENINYFDLQDSDEEYRFGYSNYKSILGTWGQINSKGFLFNLDAIPCLTTFEIDVKGEFILNISCGWKTINNEIIYIETFQYTQIKKVILKNQCNYIRIDNKSNDNVIINSINFYYEGYIVPEPEGLFSNSFKYTFDNSNNSCTITGIENKENVTNIYVPDYYQTYKVSKIEHAAFAGCSNLLKIRVPFVNDQISSESNYNSYGYNCLFGRLFGENEYDNSTPCQQRQSYIIGNTGTERYHIFYLPAGLKEVIVEDGETTGIFNGCRLIEKITYGYGIKEIGSLACANCCNLKEITCKNNEIKIGYSAFKNCTSLSLDILNNARIIGERSFAGCSFEILDIPECVTTLLHGAFYDCVISKAIHIPNTVITMEDIIFNYQQQKPIIYCESENKPNGWHKDWNYYKYEVLWGHYGYMSNYWIAKSDGRYCLKEYLGNIYDKIILPTFDDVCLLQGYALYTNLFNNFLDLTYVDISEQCNYIYDNAFNSCLNLRYIVIHNGKIKISDNAFGDNNQAECIFFSGDILEWKNENVICELPVAYYSKNKKCDFENKIFYWKYNDAGIPTLNI